MQVTDEREEIFNCFFIDFGLYVRFDRKKMLTLSRYDKKRIRTCLTEEKGKDCTTTACCAFE